MSSAPKKNFQININLIPQEEFPLPLRNIVPWSLGIGKVLLPLIEIALIVILILNIKLTVDKNSLSNSINDELKLLQRKSESETQIKSFQNKLSFITRLQNAHQSVIPLLDEIELRLPQDALITEMRFENQKLVLSGNLHTPEGLQALISSLRESKKIKNLDITQLTVPTPQSPLYTFTAVAGLGVTK